MSLNAGRQRHVGRCWGVAAGVGALVLASCASRGEVAVERSNLIDGAMTVDLEPSIGDRADTSTSAGDPGSGGTPDSGEDFDLGDASLDTTGALQWTGCDDFGIPPAEFLDTRGWQCSTLSVTMDPLGGTRGLDAVELAITRHRATGTRQGVLLMNPGGPGASGLSSVWSLRGAFPADILRGFDIVSWDPRGVGHSRPTISCGAEPDLGSATLMQDCARETGELAAFISAPYSAVDMEAIRIALGAPVLNYLGYSYGTILGAMYAERFGEHVGRFVLDGATGPLTGSADGFFDDGFPYYADDDIAEVAERFEDLCDLTSRCPLGDDTGGTLDRLNATVDTLLTPNYAPAPDVVSADLLAELQASALQYAGDWELLATALADAASGDASALAALSTVDTGLSSDALGEDASSFEVANIVIYCANFAHVIVDRTFCDGLPRNEFPLVPIEAVDVDEPILVIGTAFDPSTPGKHAAEFADALVEAVHVIWDGVGHTAFPAPTPCIDGIVSRYLVDGVIPEAGMVCAFLDGIADDAALADRLFGHGDIESERLLVDAVRQRADVSADAVCVARLINQLSDQVISHVVLGVTSDQAEDAVAQASAGC